MSNVAVSGIPFLGNATDTLHSLLEYAILKAPADRIVPHCADEPAA